MINRKEFMQEMQLRAHIREAIKVVKKRRTEVFEEEQKLRTVIRQLINEADPAVSTDAVHSNTGINALEDLFKNTNLLSVLRQGYKSLTTRKKTDPPTGITKQRRSYKNHILNAVDSSLEVEASRYQANPEEDLKEIVDIDVGDPEDNPAFIDVEEKEPTKEDEVDDFTISGQDKTGRNRAYTDYKDVEKNVITAFDDLDDAEDREMFKDYMLTNLKLYFQRFEEELAEFLKEPPGIETPPDAEVAPAPEESAEGDLGFGLQEKVNLDMDEIVEWLLLKDMK